MTTTTDNPAMRIPPERAPRLPAIASGAALLCAVCLAVAQPRAEWRDATDTVPSVAHPDWLSGEIVLWACTEGLARSSASGNWQILPMDRPIVPNSGPIVAPGGRHVAVLVQTRAGAEVRLIDTDSWAVVASTSDRQPLRLRGGWGAWRPDGSAFCFISGDGEDPTRSHLELINLSGATEPLTREGMHLDSCPRFVSDSEVVFCRLDYSRTEQDVVTVSRPPNVSEILVLDTRTQELSPVTADRVDRAPVVSPAGDILFTRSDRVHGQVVYVAERGGETYPLIGNVLTFPVSADAPAAWLPDNSRLVVQSGAGLYVVKVPTGEASRIRTAERVDRGCWAVSADGHAVAYAARGRGGVASLLP